MANQNFVVHNGLTVGQTTIDAATSNVSIPVGKAITIGNIIMRDNGDGKLHIRDITDNSDAVLVGTVSAVSVTDGNIQIGTNHIESINTDGPVSIRPNGAGVLVFASNLVSAGKGYSDFTIATGLAMPGQYGVTYANANIILSPGRVGLYSGNVYINQTTPATSPTTGALQVVGGAGIQGALYTGGYINTAGNIVSTGAVHNSLTVNGATQLNSTLGVTGVTQVTNATNSTGASSGALQVSGGAYIAQDLWVTGNLYAGNVVGIISNIATVQDGLIYLDRTSVYPYNYSIGMYSHYVGGPANTYVHTALTRQPNDNQWWFVSNIAEPNPLTGNINVYDANRIMDSIQAGNINLTGNIISTGAIHNSLTVNGATTQAGTLTVSSGFINSVGNVVATGGVFNALTVNGATTQAGAITPSANITYNLGALSGGWWGTVYSNAFQGTAVNAQYADLAEKYQADAQYEPGTVVQFGGEFEVTIAEEGTRKVAGVVSTNPGYLMNGTLSGENSIELALTGRVPCKVKGYIQKGDMMVSAGGGYARASAMPQIGTVIGKALEDFDGTEGVIEVVVGRL